MDELETRLAALELLFAELAADVEPQRLMVALERIAGGLAGAVDDRETTIRRQAIQHLDEALRRHDLFSQGALYRRRET